MLDTDTLDTLNARQRQALAALNATLIERANALTRELEDAGRAVRFEARAEPAGLRFDIQDEGIGIPTADQARLFEAFHRASNALHVPGTGLGLAIVKQSVDLHAGAITFESKEGIGTTFTVILPQTPTDRFGCA
jgi:signal transduction histidine kinase